MIIKFNPQRAEKQTVVSLNGTTLTYNGESIGLDTIPDGATATNEYITIDKAEDTVVTLLWQYTDNTVVNSFPADLVNPTDGDIKPIWSTKDGI